MEFWGVEVKAGEPVKCQPGEKLIHLSQASLGEVKKDKSNDSIPIFVKVGDQKLVLGTLSPEKCANISFDLVFERDFELSHNWKHGSIYFCGYRSMSQYDSEDYTESDSEEEIPINTKENGKPVVKEEQMKPASDKAKAAVKPESLAAKPKVQIVEPSNAKKDADDSDDSDADEDESSDDGSDDDEDMIGAGDESDDDDDDESSDEEDEATPKKNEKGNKRAAESTAKTPVQEKKAKLATPTGQKPGAGGKKGVVHVATPYPSKQGKTPANSDKSPQTPKSGGQFSCKPCNKSFNSDNALQSHTKAKHSGGK